MVGRGIADAVVGGLDGVHLHLGKFRQDLGCVIQRGPVELDVLARGEVTVTLIVGSSYVRKPSQLRRRNEAIGDRHAQHRRVALDVEAVLQPQRAEVVLRQLAGKVAARLVAELTYALVHDALVDFVVLVHVLCPARWSARPRGPAVKGFANTGRSVINSGYKKNE